MKKVFSIFIVLTTLLMSLSACAQKAQGTAPVSSIAESPSSLTKILVDKTVKAPVTVEYEGKKILPVSPLVDRASADRSVQYLMKASQEVVRAKVKDITFTVIQAMPVIKVDVEIEESLMGELKENDVISVFEFGGYIPMKTEMEHAGGSHSNLTEEEINNTVYKYVIDGEPFPVVGNESVLFLTKSPESYVAGAYARVAAYIGEFTFTDGKDALQRYEPSVDWHSAEPDTDPLHFLKYSYSELKEKVLSFAKS